jgi:hypothetical protein
MVLFTQFTMPGALLDWIQRLPTNVHYMQVEHAYLWDRHATLKGFWRLLLQGKDAGEMWKITSFLHATSFLAIATLLVRAAWSHMRARSVDCCWSRTTERTWRDRLISATICCAPLLMPFYFDYDLLLLTVPAVLLAAEELARPLEERCEASHKWLLRAWLGLYAWMLINPGMASATRVNLNVVLLSAVAVLMIRRATRRMHEEVALTGEVTAVTVTIARKAA